MAAIPPAGEPAARSAREIGGVLVLLFLLWGGAPPLAAAQDGPEESAAEALSALDKALPRYRYTAIQEALVELDGVYEKVSERTKKRIEKSVAGVFATRPARDVDPDAGLDAESLLLPAYSLCAGMMFDKPAGGRLLTDALKHKHVKEWTGARALLVEALGASGDAAHTALLTGYLVDAEAVVVIAAARALGGFSEAPGPLRRTLAKALIDAWMQHHQAAEKEGRRSRGKDETRREFLLQVEGSFSTALTSVARQAFRTPQEWQDWFGEYGRGESF